MADYGVLYEFTCPNGHQYRAAKVYRKAQSEKQALQMFSRDIHACGHCSTPWLEKVSAGNYPFEMNEEMKMYLSWKSIPLSHVD